MTKEIYQLRRERLPKLVEEGLCKSAIAERLGMSSAAVTQLLNKMGLRLKSRETIGVAA